MVFRNLEYRQQDGNYGMELFEMTVVTDWERGAAGPGFELEDWIYEKAEGYIESIVTGRAIQGQGVCL